MFTVARAKTIHSLRKLLVKELSELSILMSLKPAKQPCKAKLLY